MATATHLAKGNPIAARPSSYALSLIVDFVQMSPTLSSHCPVGGCVCLVCVVKCGLGNEVALARNAAAPGPPEGAATCIWPKY